MRRVLVYMRRARLMADSMSPMIAFGEVVGSYLYVTSYQLTHKSLLPYKSILPCIPFDWVLNLLVARPEDLLVTSTITPYLHVSSRNLTSACRQISAHVTSTSPQIISANHLLSPVHPVLSVCHLMSSHLCI